MSARLRGQIEDDATDWRILCRGQPFRVQPYIGTGGLRHDEYSHESSGRIWHAVFGYAIAPAAHAQLVNSEWNTGNGNWNVATNWFPNAVPDNGGGFTYDVQIGNRARGGRGGRDVRPRGRHERHDFDLLS